MHPVLSALSFLLSLLFQHPLTRALLSLGLPLLVERHALDVSFPAFFGGPCLFLPRMLSGRRSIGGGAVVALSPL